MLITKEVLKCLVKAVEDIPGIEKVYDYYPPEIISAELPIAIITPSRSTYQYLAEDLVKDPRFYSVLVIYNSPLEGREGDSAHDTYDLHDAVKMYLQKVDVLTTESGEGVFVEAHSDDGIALRNYPAGSNATFFSTIWTLICSEWDNL